MLTCAQSLIHIFAYVISLNYLCKRSVSTTCFSLPALHKTANSHRPMCIAIAFVITIAFMVLASGQVVKYISKFPELKMASLVFVGAIGVVIH